MNPVAARDKALHVVDGVKFHIDALRWTAAACVCLAEKRYQDAAECILDATLCTMDAVAEFAAIADEPPKEPAP